MSWPCGILRWAFALGAIALGALPAVSTGEDWPHWRGADRNGVVREPSGWTPRGWLGREPVWTRNVGEGGTSPIVVKGRLYTMGWSGGRDAVTCLDAATGSVVWTQSYPSPRYGRRATGDEGLYAGPSSTPEFDPETGYLFTLSLDGELNCWDTGADGRRVWRLNLYDDYQVPRRPKIGRQGLRDYGYTTAPLVTGDSVIVEVGDDEGNLMAFAKTTGRRQWASQNKDPAGHTGGLVPITVEGVPCVAVLTLRNLLVARLDRGHEGRTVAEYEWATEFANNIATPAVHDDSVLVTSGYNHESICRLRITLGGARKLWEQPVHSKICSPVVYRGHMYWSFQTLHCVDFETGEPRWAGGSFGDAGSCVVTGDGRLVVWSGRGKLSLVETAVSSPREYKPLAEINNVAATDVWPHVVLAGGRLFCKDRVGNLKCFATGGDSASLAAKPKPEPRPADRPPVSPPKATSPALPLNLKSWPGESPGLLLAWRKGLGRDKLLGSLVSGGNTVKLETRGAATIGNGGMALDGGAVLVRGADDALVAACKQTGELSIEVVFASARDRQSGPARIVTFSTDGFSRNFTLAQEGDQLLFRLRTPQTGENGMNPQTSLCPITKSRPRHAIVAYRDGELTCYLDGRLVQKSSAVRGDFSNWVPHHLLLGDEWTGDGTRTWSGRIDAVALYARAIAADEAAKRFDLLSREPTKP